MLIRQRKAVAVPGVSGVSGDERYHVRARDQVRARVCARTRMDINLDGDTGDTGDTDKKTQQPQGNQVSPAVSPAPSSTGDTLAIHEVRALEVRHLGELPIPFTLHLSDREIGPVLVSTSRHAVQEARKARQVAWTPIGFETAAYALQEGRAGAREWAWWCRELHRRPDWRLEAAQALRGGPTGDAEGRALVARLTAARRQRPITEPTITIGRMLDAVGALLVDVVLEEAA